MKKILIFVLLLAVCLGVAACKKDDGTPEGMMDVSAANVAYRLFVPNTWLANNEGGVSGGYVSSSDRSNVTVTSYLPDIDDITPTSYWETICLPNYQNGTLGNFFTVGEGADTTLGGRNARRYEFAFSMDGANYQCLQVITVHDRIVYTLTYTALGEKYDSHLEEVESIVSSFVFK